jgi:hypothetical protein
MSLSQATYPNADSNRNTRHIAQSGGLFFFRVVPWIPWFNSSSYFGCGQRPRQVFRDDNLLKYTNHGTHGCSRKKNKERAIAVVSTLCQFSKAIGQA